jgi:hypothetical protein
MSTPEHPGQGDQDAPISEDEFQAQTPEGAAALAREQEQALATLATLGEVWEREQEQALAALGEAQEGVEPRELEEELAALAVLAALGEVRAEEESEELGLEESEEEREEWEESGYRPMIREMAEGERVILPPTPREQAPGTRSSNSWLGVIEGSHTQLSTSARRGWVAEARRQVQENREQGNRERGHDGQGWDGGR